MENVEKDIPLTTMAMVLFYLPFMQVILKDYGICIDQGLVLITEDQHAARTFVECYCQHYAGCAVKVGLKDYMKKELDNYCAGVLNYSVGKVEQLEEFLECKTFFPIVVSGGVLPQELRSDHYVFRMKGLDLACVCLPQVQKTINKMKEYVVNNVDVICRTLELLDSSESIQNYDESAKYFMLDRMLMAVNEIHRCFTRYTYGEKFEKFISQHFVLECKKYLNKMENFADGQDLQELLALALWDAVEIGEVSKICSIDGVNEDVLNLMQTDIVIFYDEEYYYIEEANLRCLSERILNGYSWVEFKHQMADLNLIEKTGAGFTFKKSISVGNETKRVRVVKLHKEFLLNSERGLLEDHSIEKEEDTYD